MLYICCVFCERLDNQLQAFSQKPFNAGVASQCRAVLPISLKQLLAELRTVQFCNPPESVCVPLSPKGKWQYST